MIYFAIFNPVSRIGEISLFGPPTYLLGFFAHREDPEISFHPFSLAWVNATPFIAYVSPSGVVKVTAVSSTLPILPNDSTRIVPASTVKGHLSPKSSRVTYPSGRGVGPAVASGGGFLLGSSGAFAIATRSKKPTTIPIAHLTGFAFVEFVISVFSVLSVSLANTDTRAAEKVAK